jgi:hypothetical protein
MFVPPRLPDSEANCSLRKYDILMDPFTEAVNLSRHALPPYSTRHLLDWDIEFARG